MATNKLVNIPGSYKHISRFHVSKQGGIYVMTLLDWYVAGFSPMVTATSEVLVVSYVYGKQMKTKQPKEKNVHKP